MISMHDLLARCYLFTTATLIVQLGGGGYSTRIVGLCRSTGLLELEVRTWAVSEIIVPLFEGVESTLVVHSSTFGILEFASVPLLRRSHRM